MSETQAMFCDLVLSLSEVNAWAANGSLVEPALSSIRRPLKRTFDRALEKLVAMESSLGDGVKAYVAVKEAVDLIFEIRRHAETDIAMELARQVEQIIPRIDQLLGKHIGKIILEVCQTNTQRAQITSDNGPKNSVVSDE
jgi:hypothetical protein